MKLKDLPEGGVFRALNDMMPVVKLRQGKRLVLVGRMGSKDSMYFLDGEQEVVDVKFIFNIGEFFDLTAIDQMIAKEVVSDE